MRDPLFDKDGSVREGQISEAARRAESMIGFAQATENLAAWCLAFVGQSDLADSESTIPLAFLGYLGNSSEVFPDVPTHDVRAALRTGLNACLGTYDHILRDVSSLLLARATCSALVKGLNATNLPAAVLVPRLFKLCGADSLAYDALDAALGEALKEGKPARNAMLEYLGECVADINQDPGQFVYDQDRDAFGRHVLEWREKRLSLYDLWRGSAAQQFLPNFDRLDFVDAVMKAAPSETLRVLDQLRFPQPLDWILSHGSIRHDRDRMTKLTQVAPSSVDCDGGWNGSVLAMFFLKEADNYCRDCWRTAHQNGVNSKEVRERLLSWLTQVAAVVVGRDDGMFLGTQWLLMKSMDERFERRSIDDRDFLPQLEMIGWIGGGLVDAGLKEKDIPSAPRPNAELTADSGASRPSQEAASLDTIALAAMLGQLDEKTVLDSQLLLSQLDVLLADRDPGFEVEVTFDVGTAGFVDSSIGYLLAMEDCADRWKQSWNRLTEQRRVVQHWRHTKDGNALAPSLFLVRAGLAALDWLCSESFDRREVAEMLWRTMFDAARECWLTISVTHLTQSIERDIGRLFCRHPMVFGAWTAKPDLNRPYSQLLADDLGNLGGDDVLMARCCELVLRNLQDQRHLHHALQNNSSRGHVLLEQFVRWQKLERRVKRHPQLRQAVEKILAKVE